MASFEDKLLAIASHLSKDEREQLLAYAEFLEHPPVRCVRDR